MPHGVSWFNFLPGYKQLEEFLNAYLGRSFIDQKELVAQHIVSAIFVFIIIVTLALLTRSILIRDREDIIGDGRISVTNFFDALFEMLLNQMRSIIGHRAEEHFPFVATIILFILFSNLLGLIPGFLPPTNNLNTTAACAISVFFYYHYIGIKKQGFFNYINHMINPIGEWWGYLLCWLMFPIELIGHLARPLSLSLRLMGNMTGDHAVLAIFLGLFPIILPMPFIILGLIVAIVQSFIFAILTCVYIAMAQEHNE
ncbi:MAG: F0F1 ATP synthase subunit A [Deltaproteobacteria bacterium]|nr:F0F1 ATP synthase subunit A [Deltaproteobacteria bacterium]